MRNANYQSWKSTQEGSARRPGRRRADKESKLGKMESIFGKQARKTKCTSINPKQVDMII